MRNVRSFNFPPLREFSVAELLEEYLEDAEVRAHLPDDIFAPERTFLHAVLGTLKPDEIGERIDAALRKRGSAVEDEEAAQRIQVLPGIVEKLRATNAKPRTQRGRALAQLKDKRRGRPQELARPFLGKKRKASRPLPAATPAKRKKLPQPDEEVLERA